MKTKKSKIDMKVDAAIEAMKVARVAGGQPGNQNSKGHGRPKSLEGDLRHIGVVLDDPSFNAMAALREKWKCSQGGVVRKLLIRAASMVGKAKK